MVFKNKRQVVIINDIKSDSIEQAIFILRDKKENSPTPPSDIVGEAQRIINSFSKYSTLGVYNTQKDTKPIFKSRKDVIFSGFVWLISAASVVGLSTLILCLI